MSSIKAIGTLYPAFDRIYRAYILVGVKEKLSKIENGLLKRSMLYKLFEKEVLELAGTFFENFDKNGGDGNGFLGVY